jgi:hypothetical protein
MGRLGALPSNALLEQRPMTEFTVTDRHYCRYPRCRSRLPAPLHSGLPFRVLPHPLSCLRSQDGA